MNSYEQQVLDHIDTLLVGEENDLVALYSKLNDAISQTVKTNGKLMRDMADKLIRSIDKQATAQEDALDAAQTVVLQGIDTWLSDQEFLLQNLAVKGGLIQPGDPVMQALIEESTKAPDLAYLGTLVLEIGQLTPVLERIAVAVETLAGIGAKPSTGSLGFAADLIEVLREIRDRQPSPPIRTADEFAAIAAAEVADDPNIQAYYK